MPKAPTTTRVHEDNGRGVVLPVPGGVKVGANPANRVSRSSRFPSEGVRTENPLATDPDQADCTAMLRQLMSENKISRDVTVKQEGGFTSVHVEQAGPIGFTATTTAKTIFVKDLNRCLQAWVNESKEQTKRIVAQITDTYLPGTKRADPEPILRRHREFQESIETGIDIRIPYGDVLRDNLPTEHLEMRRLCQLLVSTIEAVVLLYSFQRKKNEDGQLLATEEDYALARRLLLRSLHEVIGGKEWYAKYEMLRPKLTRETFTSQDVTEVIGSSNRMATFRLTESLVKAGVIRGVKKSIGNAPAVFRWTGKDPGEIVLPGVDLIEKAMRNV